MNEDVMKSNYLFYETHIADIVNYFHLFYIIQLLTHIWCCYESQFCKVKDVLYITENCFM